VWQYTRRQWIGTTTAAAAGLAVARRAAWAAAPAPAKGLTLSIGTYSLKGLSIAESIKLLAGIGYDAIEIATQPGQAGEPSLLSRDARKQVRGQLADAGLKLTALMENLFPAKDDQQHAADLERLGRVMELATALSPGAPPLVQTVLGGREWEKQKALFCDRLGDWAQVARRNGAVLAVKPHRLQAMSRPSEAIWLIRQLGDPPWLRMVYDYGHYVFRDMPLEATVAESLPYTAHVVVKDTLVEDGKDRFFLAGETGTIDYPKLLRLFSEGGYRGDVCCEVSVTIWRNADYDAAATARTCYRNMAAAFKAAGVPRGAKPQA